MVYYGGYLQDGTVMGEPRLTPKAPRMVDAHVGADADVNQAQVHLDDVRVQLEAAAEEDVVAAGADSAAGSAIAESGAALAAADADADEAQADAVEGVRVDQSGSEVHAEEDVKVDEVRHAAAAEDAADTQALALQQTPAPTVEASDTLPVPAALKPVRKIAKAPGCFGNVFKGCFGGAAQRSP